MYIVIEIFDKNDCEKYEPSYFKIEDKYMKEKCDKVKCMEELMKRVRNKFSLIPDDYYDEYIELEIHYLDDVDFTTINIDD